MSIIRILFLQIIFFFSYITISNGQLSVVPAVRDWKPAEGKLQLAKTFKVVLNKSNGSSFKNVSELFVSDLKEISSLTPTISEAVQSEPGVIFFTFDKSLSELGPEGYKISITDRIEVGATTMKGFFYATQNNLTEILIKVLLTIILLSAPVL